MNIETVIYLADILPKFQGFIVLGFLGLSLSFFGLSFSYIEDYLPIRKPLFFTSFFSVFLIFISLLMPSEKTIYLMLGANYLKNSTLPSKVEMAIEKKINEYLVESKK